MNGKGGFDLMAQLVYHEAGTIRESDKSNYSGYYEELTAIGTAIINQVYVDQGFLIMFGKNGNQLQSCPLGRCGNRSLKDIILLIARDNAGRIFDNDGNMRSSSRNRLDIVLGIDDKSPPLIGDINGEMYNQGCEGLWTSIKVASQLLTGERRPYFPNELLLLYWNGVEDVNNTSAFPGSEGYVGVKTSRTRSQTFWGAFWSFAPKTTPRDDSGRTPSAPTTRTGGRSEGRVAN
jgi:hypothetical protein